MALTIASPLERKMAMNRRQLLHHCQQRIHRIRYFAVYTAWLSAFAMSGPFADKGLLLYFLMPHVLGLLLFTQRMAANWFQPALRVGLWCCIIGTLGYAAIERMVPMLMMVLGLAAAPVCLRASIALRETVNPLHSAWIGLTAGHVLMLALANLPKFGMAYAPDPGPVLLAGLLLWLVNTPPAGNEHLTGRVTANFRLLVPIFFFQIASGLMYGRLFPAFAEQGLWAETHLIMLFYPLGAFLALRILRYRPDATLLAGVFLALLGFSLWPLLPVALGANIGMAFTLCAAGIVDLLLLSHILSFRNQLKATGYGVAVLCSGIILGKLIALWSGVGSTTIGLFSLAALNVAALLLSLFKGIAVTQVQCAASAEIDPFPDLPWVAQLSTQERFVLIRVYQRNTYHDIATEMKVSESTVKTYMQRIYRKSGMYNRQQLLKALAESHVWASQGSDQEMH